MNKNKSKFKFFYFIYVGILILIGISTIFYIKNLLVEHEEKQPDRQVEKAIIELKSKAKDKSFWEFFECNNIEELSFEDKTNLKNKYLELYENDSLKYNCEKSLSEEDKLVYYVENNGFPLARINLKATSPNKVKLMVLNIRDWEVESIEPLLNKKDYKFIVPANFYVLVNGKNVDDNDKKLQGNKVEYTLQGLYLPPELTIKDNEGNLGEYFFQKDKIIVNLYDYEMVLPEGLNVEVNDEINIGEKLIDGRIKYKICLLAKPKIKILDYFGNEIYYEKGEKLPIKYMTIKTPSDYKVYVDEKEVPSELFSKGVDPDYQSFSKFVPDLPQICTYKIAVLNEKSAIKVIDSFDKVIELEEEKHDFNFINTVECLSEIPKKVSDEVDVLQIAQNWSLFMSKDLSFSKLINDLLPGSYQYEVARKYANGIDIQFTSEHTLMNPTFTDEFIKNFTWISNNCFSVDISFVKHMKLKGGREIKDSMNDRFYFVLYDATNDNQDNPTWKLASMKEIIDNVK